MSSPTTKTATSRRNDGRAPDELRPVRLTRGWAKHAEGSCLTEFGDTKVLCTASVESGVPAWLRNSGSGWLTAEYGMLPRSTGKRNQRDGTRPRPDGRAMEIQRLIGRSLRSVVDLKLLGERTIIIDCDVLQADGGTRCAAITGAWVALYEALAGLRAAKVIQKSPLKQQVTAVSVGVVGAELLLDLSYAEDSRAAVDMNVVMTTQNRLIEVQAGGEGQTFSTDELSGLLNLAAGGISRLIPLQDEAIRDLV